MVPSTLTGTVTGKSTGVFDRGATVLVGEVFLKLGIDRGSFSSSERLRRNGAVLSRTCSQSRGEADSEWLLEPDIGLFVSAME